MLIHHKTSFVKGVVLLGTFVIICTFLLFPMLRDEYGNHLTGLQYADSVFNSLSKGSSYFVPAVRENVSTVMGKSVKMDVALNHEMAESMVKVYASCGARAHINGNRLIIMGDLGAILSAATDVGDRLYFNDTKTIESKYKQPALLVSRCFWYTLNPGIKDLQRQGMIAEAKVVDQVLRRALEPGNNFFSVPVAKVSDHIFLIVVMLMFYIIYTLWYGFGIMEIFQGIGLSLHK